MKYFYKPIVLLLFIAYALPSFSQDKENKLKFNFYGFIRADYYYDTRQSVASNEGLLFLYPKDESLDYFEEDLNAVPNGSLYSFITRPGLEITGLNVFDADLKGVIEADFAGFSGSNTLLRIRLAYLKFNWEKSSLLVGQDWHPLFDPVRPQQLSISTGAPFQPFNRSPQLKFNYKVDKVTFTGATVWQLQHNSTGPDGKSGVYLKNAIVPELAFMVDYKNQHVQFGAGIDYLTLKPRTQSTVMPEGSQYSQKVKVDEKIGSLSYLAYLKYTYGLFSASVKSGIMENPVHLNMLGGYGIKSSDAATGVQEYTPFRHSSTWLNFSYGKKYLGNLFLGYNKNLGSKDALLENSAMYGEGLTIQELYRACLSFSYNIPHFRLGMEYEYSLAKYGDTGTMSWEDGLYDSTHGVTGHRLIATISYIF